MAVIYLYDCRTGVIGNIYTICCILSTLQQHSVDRSIYTSFSMPNDPSTVLEKFRVQACVL